MVKKIRLSRSISRNGIARADRVDQWMIVKACETMGDRFAG